MKQLSQQQSITSVPLSRWLTIYVSVGALDVLLAAAVQHDLLLAAQLALALAVNGMLLRHAARLWPFGGRLWFSVICLGFLLLLPYVAYQ